LPALLFHFIKTFLKVSFYLRSQISHKKIKYTGAGSSKLCILYRYRGPLEEEGRAFNQSLVLTHQATLRHIQQKPIS